MTANENKNDEDDNHECSDDLYSVPGWHSVGVHCPGVVDDDDSDYDDDNDNDANGDDANCQWWWWRCQWWWWLSPRCPIQLQGAAAHVFNARVLRHSKTVLFRLESSSSSSSSGFLVINPHYNDMRSSVTSVNQSSQSSWKFAAISVSSILVMRDFILTI